MSDNPGWHRVVIALGSNMGERDEELFKAVADLRATEGIRVVAESAIIETTALTASGYDESAPQYLNQVILIDTVWEPEALLQIVLDIESQHGRVRTGERYASRTLDIDLIDYAGQTLSGESLHLPHPRAHEREFVLRPWLSIDPTATLPGRGLVSDLLTALER